MTTNARQKTPNGRHNVIWEILVDKKRIGKINGYGGTKIYGRTKIKKTKSKLRSEWSELPDQGNSYV